MFAGSLVQAVTVIAFAVPFILLLLIVAFLSIHRIGPNEVGLVIRRWGPRRAQDGPIAFHGEAGYQADLLMPGIAVRVWPINRVEKHPWVQIPTGEVGLVIAQAGDEPTVLVADCREDRIERVREAVPALRHRTLRSGCAEPGGTVAR